MHGALDSIGRSLFACAATFGLASCSSGATQAGGPSPRSLSAVTLDRASKAPHSAKDDLLYVSDLGTGDVDVYSYPGGRLEETLSGFAAPHGECVDAAGNVFITNTGAGTILEYAHGGAKPIATLNDAGYSPVDCSVDPTTGNLAVTNLTVAVGSGSGNVLIFKKAKGEPEVYSLSTMFFYYSCGYDDKGDLYVDGGARNTGGFVFAGLPAGEKSLKSISLDQPIQIPGGVKWDGEHVAVEDQGVASQGSTIYRFTIRGSTGTVVGTTPLTGSSDVIDFWIQGRTVVGPNSAGNVLYWNYPEGGTVKRSITGLSDPVAAAVSVGSRSQ